MLIPLPQRSSRPVRSSSSWAPHPAAHCSTCSMRHLCMPQGLNTEAVERLESVICAARPVRRGEALFREGDEFDNLYAVRSGSIKTIATRQDGREQVAGLHLAGEALGFDGICDSHHPRTAVALEDSTVCVIPYGSLRSLCSEASTLQARVLKLMSEQIVRETTQAILLGSLNADERVASFLLDVSARYMVRGYSATEFNLRMTREDIGSYLGITLETVSRTLSKFQRQGLLVMQGRVVRVLDFDGLRAI
ncbi:MULTISPECIES: fumarate/nitrate reduction transcriptional regulator Fnr [Burkholderia]|uniref:Transcriptional regulator, Crp/Fnr family n=1 Tax=Burkholderia plantarii TaxID=41899 RepID=A0A0B6S178_BURPL|nr:MULTISPECIES: fumarate/nitrate reduction transcriptional regulator Fnr [Burkholderia]AJK48169.1 transcriptional regulator, Crp/Fnr family [Burkholderia plantarii]ALK32358.1 Transcriptional regulator, Crp/Fnr family [Burkholderia plantarii]WLE61483.1 fumarate/nitrate reduction transcriptional regulator Fnr [Burkholderia plantarii]